MGNYTCCTLRDEKEPVINSSMTFMGLTVLSDQVPHISTYLNNVLLTQKILWSFGGTIEIYQTSDNKAICSL